MPLSTIDADVAPAIVSASATDEPTTWRARVAWGGTGFVLGMVVWHFVGFWSFMTTIVYRGPDPHSAAAMSKLFHSVRLPPVETAQAKTHAPADPVAVAADGTDDACSTLVLDRATRTTQLAACPADSQNLTLAASVPRSDSLLVREQREAGLATTVEAQVTASD